MISALKYVVIVLFAIIVFPAIDAYADSHPISRSSFNEWYNQALNTIKNYEQIFMSQKSEINSLRNQIEQLDQKLISQISVTNPIIGGLMNGNLTYYIEPLPSWSTYNISLFDDFLNERIEKGVILQRVYNESLADFSVKWVRDYGDEHLGVAYNRTTATVGLGSSDCGDWQHFDDFSITKIAWHEIGHVLGYGHSDDPNNIMYSTTYTQYNSDITIDEVISPSWYGWYNFCTSGEQQFSVSTSTEDDGVEIIVLPPETDVSDFIEYDVGSYYTCTEPGETWHEYTWTCNVDPYSNLVIVNNQNNAIRVDGWIKNFNGHPDIEMRWDDKAYVYNPEYLDYVWKLFNN